MKNRIHKIINIVLAIGLVFAFVWAVKPKETPVPVDYQIPLTLGNGGLSLWVDSTNAITGYVSNYKFRKSIDSLGAIIATLSPIVLSAGQGISITGTTTKTISLVAPTLTITGRIVNTVFTPSTTRYTVCAYGLTCSVTNPLIAGSSTADVYLEYLPVGTSTWLPAIRNGNSSSVGLAVAIQITNGQTGTLTGWVTPNSAVRIRSVITGTASVTIVSQQEVNIY